MPYSEPFTRVTFGGTLADGQDEWNCGLAVHLVPSTGKTWTEAATEAAPQISDLLQTFFGHANTLAPSGSQLEYVKLAHIGTDGLYIEPPILDTFTPVTGGVAASYVPQNSLVITMQANKYKDPGKYNRFYLPIASFSGGGQYKLNTTQQSNVLDNAKTLFDGINAATGTDYDTLFSVVVSNSGGGSMITTDKIKTGVIVDTQRRRRNKLAEAYATIDLA